MAANFIDQCYRVGLNPKNPEMMGVATTLDNFLMRKEFDTKKVKMSMHSWFDLSEIYSFNTDDLAVVKVNTENFKDFADKVVQSFQNKVHETTDHLVLWIQLNYTETPVNIVYVSLENSVRSTANGADFGNRWTGFLKLFELFKEKSIDFVFASEAGRDVFKEGVKFTPDRKTCLTEVTRKWNDLTEELYYKVGYKQICLSMNNPDTFDGKVLSFGVALFHLQVNPVGYEAKEVHFAPKNSFGSGAVELTVNFGGERIGILGVHFPLNFAKGESENPVTDLCDKLNYYDGSIIFGDLNTVDAGFSRYDTVKKMMTNYDMLLKPTYPTFFSSWCDNEIPVKEKGDCRSVTDIC